MSQEKEQAATQKNEREENGQQPIQTMEATRVTVTEVKERMDRGEQFTFVDTRNPKAWAEADAKLPGAIRIPADEAEQHLKEIPRGRTVITYCT